tara:strand:- start:579 stop:2657 length:2079 start_codon:yes stop_codon:yes gene_type:complete
MAIGDDVNKAREETKKLTEETGFLIDAFTSLGATITGAIDDAIQSAQGLDSTGKKIADTFSKDITRGLKGVVSSLDEQLAIQIKIQKGQNATKDIEKAREKSAAKLAAIRARIEILKRNGIGVDAEAVQELENQEAIQNEILDQLQDQSDEAVRQRGIFANLRDVLTDNLDKIDETGTLSKLVTFKNALADGDLFKLTLVAILKATLDASSAIANLRKETGLSYESARELQLEFGKIAVNSEKLYVTTQDVGKAFAELTKQTGFIADFGGDTLVTFTTLNKQLGLSEEAAGSLATFARIQGENTEDILSNTVDTVSSLNKQERVAVNVKQVLQDVASASKSIAASVGFAPDSLARAAREARKLGLSLSEVDAVAESLLQFETSIEAELEAELLTGKQINLEKARQFALTNDLEGLSKEIANNEEIISAFSSQNRIQQQAVADSLGVSRDQLAQMALSQKLATMSAEEFKDAYGEATYESLATQSATEKFQSTIQKIQSIIGDIGTVLAPIVDGFASIVGFLVESKGAASILVGILSGLAAKSLATAIGNIYQSFLQIPFGAGLPLAIGATAGLLATIASATSMYGDDIISPSQGGSGYGKRTLFGPEGAIKLNDNDTIVAGTDLKIGNDVISPGNSTEVKEVSSPSINLGPLVEQMNTMNATLNALLNKEGTVTLDGTKVGTALTVGSYKLQ